MFRLVEQQIIAFYKYNYGYCNAAVQGIIQQSFYWGKSLEAIVFTKGKKYP
jgi:hypothetical protein